MTLLAKAKYLIKEWGLLNKANTLANRKALSLSSLITKLNDLNLRY